MRRNIPQVCTKNNTFIVLELSKIHTKYFNDRSDLEKALEVFKKLRESREFLIYPSNSKTFSIEYGEESVLLNKKVSEICWLFRWIKVEDMSYLNIFWECTLSQLQDNCETYIFELERAIENINRKWEESYREDLRTHEEVLKIIQHYEL